MFKYTVKVLIERISKSESNSLNSLKAFPIMRHHLCVVFLFMRRQYTHAGTLVDWHCHAMSVLGVRNLDLFY